MSLSLSLLSSSVAGFVEQNILFLLVSIIFVIQYLPLLKDTFWSSDKLNDKDLLLFLIEISSLTYFAEFVCRTIAFIDTQSEFYVFDGVSGDAPILAALFVAFKQVVPDLPIIPAVQWLPVKFKHLPSLLVACSLLWWLVFGPHFKILEFCLGSFFAWFYLRFLQEHPETHVFGDLREEFSFASFFPSALRLVVRIFTTLCLKLITRMGFFSHLNFSSSAPNDPQPLNLLNVTDDVIAERRKLALAAIDEKLKSLNIAPVPLPSLDHHDDEEKTPLLARPPAPSDSALVHSPSAETSLPSASVSSSSSSSVSVVISLPARLTPAPASSASSSSSSSHDLQTLTVPISDSQSQPP